MNHPIFINTIFYIQQSYKTQSGCY